jgi:hypothetical protein
MKKYINLLILVLIVFGLIWVVFNSKPTRNPYQRYYAGDIRQFRSNLDEAEKIPVFPDENAVRSVLLNPSVYKVRIAYLPDEEENAYYAAASFEIANKLGIIYRENFQGNCSVDTIKENDDSSCLLFCYSFKKCFRSLPINSVNEIRSTDTEPVILLLGSKNTNRTAVTVNNYTITVEGKTFSEADRPYTDLDLATDKLILTLMV